VLTVIVKITGRYLCSVNIYCDNNDNNGIIFTITVNTTYRSPVIVTITVNTHIDLPVIVIIVTINVNTT
jgi:hypothetical protein